MYHTTTPSHAWRTASRSDATKSSGNDLRLLGEHLNTCPKLHRHLLVLHRVAESVHGFMTTRFVTTLVVLIGLFGFGYWML